MREYEIDFNGHVKCVIQIINDVPIVTKAMNGYGDAIPTENITIHEQLNEQK